MTNLNERLCGDCMFNNRIDDEFPCEICGQFDEKPFWKLLTCFSCKNVDNPSSSDECKDCHKIPLADINNHKNWEANDEYVQANLPKKNFKTCYFCKNKEKEINEKTCGGCYNQQEKRFEDWEPSEKFLDQVEKIPASIILKYDQLVSIVKEYFKIESKKEVEEIKKCSQCDELEEELDELEQLLDEDELEEQQNVEKAQKELHETDKELYKDMKRTIESELISERMKIDEINQEVQDIIDFKLRLQQNMYNQVVLLNKLRKRLKLVKEEQNPQELYKVFFNY